MQKDNCIFCKIISRQIPAEIVLETDFSIVFQDIAPQAPIHYLIVPKKHVQDLNECTVQDAQLVTDLMMLPTQLAKKMEYNQAFKLVVNNGYDAGQRVFHLHIHFLAGKHFSV